MADELNEEIGNQTTIIIMQYDNNGNVDQEGKVFHYKLMCTYVYNILSLLGRVNFSITS